MIKGINKNMVVVKNTGSKYFEEAHFIVKNSASDKSERDLVREAGRIVGAVLKESGVQSKPKSAFGKAVTFILSFVAGIAVGIVLCLLF